VSVAVTWAESCTIQETLPNNTGSASDGNRVVTHDQYNESGALNGATTPPATTQASFLLALVAGAKSVDLRALDGTNDGVIDGNGLRVQIVRVKNLGANDMTVKSGASNGHTGLFGTAGLTIPPGGVAMLYTNDGAIDIDATHKVWDVTGTGAQTSEWTVVLG
jgi:hypothetical protein